MIREHRRTLIITSIITLLPIIAGIILWNRLPDVMATSFGVDNKANGFSSKAFAVFGMPLFMLGMLWLVAFITSADPRRRNISGRIYDLILWIIPVVSIICSAFVYILNMGVGVDVSFFMQILVGILFIVLGNYMPKMRHNYTVGIRVPWTLDNEENWNRTHRLGGYLWVAGGIVLVLLALIRLPGAFLTMMLVMGIITLVPCIYSYYLHVKKGL